MMKGPGVTRRYSDSEFLGLPPTSEQFVNGE